MHRAPTVDASIYLRKYCWASRHATARARPTTTNFQLNLDTKPAGPGSDEVDDVGLSGHVEADLQKVDKLNKPVDKVEDNGRPR